MSKVPGLPQDVQSLNQFSPQGRLTVTVTVWLEMQTGLPVPKQGCPYVYFLVTSSCEKIIFFSKLPLVSPVL